MKSRHLAAPTYASSMRNTLEPLAYVMSLSNDASISVRFSTLRRTADELSFSSASIAPAELWKPLSCRCHVGSAASVMLTSLHDPSASLSQVSSHHFMVTRSPNQ